MLCLMTSLVSKAQFHYTTTITTSTSNEFLQIPTFLLEGIANVGIGTLTGDKILFAPQLIFPVSIGNSAPESFGDMRGGLCSCILCSMEAFGRLWYWHKWSMGSL